MDALDSLWRFIMNGGPVMFPLMAVSLWLWVVVLCKVVWLARLAREDADLPRVMALLADGSPAPWRWSPVGWAMAHYCTVRTGDPQADVLHWEVSVRRQIAAMWSQVSTILMLAGVAPLLGLLGTVSGMISTFEVIWQFGTGNAQALAVGISEALITTETGLLIAVPGLFAGYMIRRRVRREQQKLLGLKEAVERWIRNGEASPCCV
ncbi:hypothetical protein AAU61_17230 [Desulfocarbo indianensis]|nr:hypothetical protein AAU61_17230 [Desulfocarbo indianensis]